MYLVVIGTVRSSLRSYVLLKWLLALQKTTKLFGPFCMLSQLFENFQYFYPFPFWLPYIPFSILLMIFPAERIEAGGEISPPAPRQPTFLLKKVAFWFSTRLPLPLIAPPPNISTFDSTSFWSQSLELAGGGRACLSPGEKSYFLIINKNSYSNN